MEQDWTPVVLKKKVKPSKPLPVINAEAVRLRAIENDEPVKKRELTRESRQSLISGRIAKNLTQEQVDRVCVDSLNIQFAILRLLNLYHQALRWQSFKSMQALYLRLLIN